MSQYLLRLSKSLIRPNSVKYFKQTISKEWIGTENIFDGFLQNIMLFLYSQSFIEGGELYIKGNKVRFKTPQAAVKNGMGFWSGDRKAEGILTNLSIRDNMMISIMLYVSKRGIVDQKKMSKVTDSFIERLRSSSVFNLQGCEI
ncbi:MAG: hypothetical protein PHR92_01885 [Lachnospiraceae bacterium]|nr:hypothetical protein [Lachnospiraceae bacterium]